MSRTSVLVTDKSDVVWRHVIEHDGKSAPKVIKRIKINDPHCKPEKVPVPVGWKIASAFSSLTVLGLLGYLVVEYVTNYA